MMTYVVASKFLASLNRNLVPILAGSKLENVSVLAVNYPELRSQGGRGILSGDDGQAMRIV